MKMRRSRMGTNMRKKVEMRMGKGRGMRMRWDEDGMGTSIIKRGLITLNVRSSRVPRLKQMFKAPNRYLDGFYPACLITGARIKSVRVVNPRYHSAQQ
jgi:hypothetical protein